MLRYAPRSLALTVLCVGLPACTDDPKGSADPGALAAPVVQVLSHVDGDEVVEGQLVQFFGTASDADTFTTDLEFAFWLDGVEVCPWAAVPSGGAVECEVLVPTVGGLSGPVVSLDLEARDLDGQATMTTVSLSVIASDAPVVTILSPDDGAVAYADVPLALLGDGVDDLDGPDALVGTWESDLDGVLDSGPLDASGQLATTASLSPGTHRLKLSVEDTVGLVGSDSVALEVFETNTHPTCAIVSPTSNSAIEPGTIATFELAVDDPEEGPEGLAYTLFSNLDGELAATVMDASGTASVDVDDLTEGTHAITLEVTDTPGLACADTITFSVGTPPELELLAPSSGDLFNEDEPVVFSGTVSDVPSAPDDLTFSRVSDLDGVLSSEGAGSDGHFDVEVPVLSVGTHTITVTVTDRDGMYVDQSLTLQINGLPGAPAAALTPDPAGTEDDLVAQVVTDSVDPEDDPVTYTYGWTVDGVASTASNTATLPASATTRGETWTVTVTPDDGHGTGTAGTAALTIGNTPPVLASASLSPSVPVEGDTIACTPGSASDADGDTVTYSYAWTVDGAAAFPTSSTLDDSHWGRGQDVVCIVTPSDGLDDGTPVASGTVTIGNTAPEVGAVSIAPTLPGTLDTLTCSYSGYADVDGDADASTYAWTIGGTTVGVGATLSGGFVKGDTVTCTVTPFDGTDTGTPLSADVEIQNTAPSVSSVSISPSAPEVADTLTCSYAGYADPDGDADASTYAWSVGGTPVGTGATLAGGFVKGDTVTCTVTPSDGTDSGTPVDGSVTVANTAPVLADAALSPTDAVEGDTLTCTPGTASDADGDTVSYTYAWRVNSTGIAPTSSTLDSSYWAKNDVVVCSVTPTDGTDTGTAVDSNGVTIGNTAPVLESATVTPTDPQVASTLTCSAGPVTDVDADTITYSYAWTVGGSTVGTTDTLSGAFVKGDAVTCTITPNDGTEDGTTASDAVTIGNTAPVVATVSISPTTAGVEDTLTCSATATDADSDAVTFTYAWSTSGTTVGTAARCPAPSHRATPSPAPPRPQTAPTPAPRPRAASPSTTPRRSWAR